MAHAAKKETQGFEILGHSMTRITVVGNGSYDEFQARFDAAMPASTPQDVMRAIFQSEAMSKVARAFDFKFGRLLRSLGCSVPEILREPELSAHG
jgi:hypothetical protein